MNQSRNAHLNRAVELALFQLRDLNAPFLTPADIAPVLGIALTARNKNSADVTPMCGVPHHSIANSINKLLSAG
ncbi:MAG: hypothetical protein EOP10_26045, partial [Proteobacteria bacterium]